MHLVLESSDNLLLAKRCCILVLSSRGDEEDASRRRRCGAGLADPARDPGLGERDLGESAAVSSFPNLVCKACIEGRLWEATDRLRHPLSAMGSILCCMIA